MGATIETGCVGICVNSCKAATEAFFQHDMGLQLSIEPDLEDFSCKFHFGKTALSLEEDAMYQQQCLSACPLAFPASHKPCHAVTDAMRHAPMEGNAD